MEMKNCVEFVVKKGERTYCFHTQAGAPIGEVYDAAFEILGEIVSRAQEAVKQAAPKEVPNDSQGS